MKLYGSLASPYVARVAMFADLKGISLPGEPAPGGMGSDAYKQINPTGKIPALQTDDGIIAESTVICEYLESVFPEPALIPSDPMQQAATRMVAHMTDLYVAPHNTPLSRMRTASARDQVVIDTQAAAFAKGFANVAAYMRGEGYAAGAGPSLGDCALGPFIVLLKQTIFPNFVEVIDPTTGSGRMAEWWQAMQEDEGCKRNLDAYDVALKEFLIYLRKLMAERNKGG